MTILWNGLWWWDKRGPVPEAVEDAKARHRERQGCEAEVILIHKELNANGKIAGLRPVINEYITNKQDFMVCAVKEK